MEFKQLQCHGGLKRLYADLIPQAFLEMVKNDVVYINESFAQFSLKRIDGYMTFSENSAKRFPGYTMASDGLF